MCEMQHNSDPKNEKHTRMNKKLKQISQDRELISESRIIWGNAVFNYLLLECRKQ